MSIQLLDQDRLVHYSFSSYEELNLTKSMLFHAVKKFYKKIKSDQAFLFRFKYIKNEKYVYIKISLMIT